MLYYSKFTTSLDHDSSKCVQTLYTPIYIISINWRRKKTGRERKKVELSLINELNYFSQPFNLKSFIISKIKFFWLMKLVLLLGPGPKILLLINVVEHVAEALILKIWSWWALKELSHACWLVVGTWYEAFSILRRHRTVHHWCSWEVQVDFWTVVASIAPRTLSVFLLTNYCSGFTALPIFQTL